MRGRRTRARDTWGTGRSTERWRTPASSVRGPGGATALFETSARFVASTTIPSHGEGPAPLRPRPKVSPAGSECASPGTMRKQTPQVDHFWPSLRNAVDQARLVAACFRPALTRFAIAGLPGTVDRRLQTAERAPYCAVTDHEIFPGAQKCSGPHQEFVLRSICCG